METEVGTKRGLDHSDPSGRIMRVGIVVNSTSPRRWVFQTIRAIQDSGVRVDILYYHLRGGGLHPLPKPHGVFARFHKWLDGRLFRSSWDEMEKTEMIPFLPPAGMEEIVLDGASPEGPALNGMKPDIALVFEDGSEPSKRVGILLGCPVWRFHIGGNHEFSEETAGFREVREDVPTTMLSLVEECGGKPPRNVATAVCPTHRYSLWKNRNNILGHAPSLAVQGLHRWVYSVESTDDEPFMVIGGVSPEGEESPPALPLWTRMAKKQIHRLIHRDQWFIGYRQGESFRPDRELENFRIAVPPRDRFWADPFPISVGNRQFIFFEEYLFKKQKAHISCVELGPRGEWGSPVTVLQRNYHMSYPLLFRFEESLYMLPETSANRTIEAYRCLSFPHEWRLEKILMENVVAADTSIRFIDGLWWMFTSLGSPDGRQFNELWVFYSDHPLGGWRSHRLNPIRIDARFARGAGNLFEWQGAIHRPAQNCSRNYGENIQVRRINELSPRFFREEEAFRLLPTWTKNVERVHTLNWSGDLTVVDGFRWRRKMFDSTC